MDKELKHQLFLSVYNGQMKDRSGQICEIMSDEELIKDAITVLTGHRTYVEQLHSLNSKLLDFSVNNNEMFKAFAQVCKVMEKDTNNCERNVNLLEKFMKELKEISKVLNGFYNVLNHMSDKLGK